MSRDEKNIMTQAKKKKKLRVERVKEVHLRLAPPPLVGVDYTAAYLPAESMLLRNLPVIFEKK